MPEIGNGVVSVQGGNLLPISSDNSAVIRAATRLRWRPKVLALRIHKAFPSIVEQHLYLRVAEDFRILPESVAKLLREFLGREELRQGDMDSIPVGENLVMNKFADVADMVEGALILTGKVADYFDGVNLSMTSAAILVQAYGPDGAEDIISALDAGLDEISLLLGATRFPYGKQMGMAISKLVLILKDANSPAPLSIHDFIGILQQGVRR